MATIIEKSNKVWRAARELGWCWPREIWGWLYGTQCSGSKMEGKPTKFLLNLYNKNNSRIIQEAKDIHSNKMYGPLLLNFRPRPSDYGRGQCSGGELCNTIISILYNYLIDLSPKKAMVIDTGNYTGKRRIIHNTQTFENITHRIWVDTYIWEFGNTMTPLLEWGPTNIFLV